MALIVGWNPVVVAIVAAPRAWYRWQGWRAVHRWERAQREEPQW